MFTTDLYGKSVYRRDYQGKQGERISPAVFEPDYPDPAAGPFLHCLLPESQKHNLPNFAKYEHHDAAIKRAIDKYPSMKTRLTDVPIDLSGIDQIYLERYRTEYSQKICGPGKTLAETYELPRMPNGRVNVMLPDGWPEPSSTYRDSYRGPVFGPNPIILPPSQPIEPPAGNFPFSKTATTGHSEYQGVIGELGGLNLQHNYHGQRKSRYIDGKVHK